MSQEHPWLYGKLSRQEAEALLMEYNLPNGLFLVRKSSHAGSYALSVCVSNRIAHHLISTAPNGTFLINSTPLPECSSLDEVGTWIYS